ncbi:MAG: hypothetical protein AAB649_05735, partial [Patescibacteria group bacterium]
MNNFLSRVNWYWAWAIGILSSFIFFMVAISTDLLGGVTTFFPHEFLVLLGVITVVWIISVAVHIILARRDGVMHFMMPVNMAMFAGIPRNVVVGLLIGVFIMEVSPYVIVPVTTGLFHREIYNMETISEVLTQGGYYGMFGDEYFDEYYDAYYDEASYGNENFDLNSYNDGYSDGLDAMDIEEIPSLG